MGSTKLTKAVFIFIGLVILFSNQIVDYVVKLGYSESTAGLVIIASVIGAIFYKLGFIEGFVKGE